VELCFQRREDLGDGLSQGPLTFSFYYLALRFLNKVALPSIPSFGFFIRIKGAWGSYSSSLLGEPKPNNSHL